VALQLEEVLREQLYIPNAMMFRRGTAHYTIRYQVIDSGDKAPSIVGLEFIQQLQLGSGSSGGSGRGSGSGKRGVVYMRSYTIGEVIGRVLHNSPDGVVGTARSANQLLLHR
jgi:hypothetical protein